MKGHSDAPVLQKELPRGVGKIMILDDEQHIIDVAKENLEELGYTIVNKTNPLDALDYFSSSIASFDLIISDMTMPKMTGLVFAQKLRDIRADIPIIICSGLENPSLLDHVKQGKINAFLPKPFSTREIAETIRKVLTSK